MPQDEGIEVRLTAGGGSDPLASRRWPLAPGDRVRIKADGIFTNTVAQSLLPGATGTIRERDEHGHVGVELDEPTHTQYWKGDGDRHPMLVYLTPDYLDPL